MDIRSEIVRPKRFWLTDESSEEHATREDAVFFVRNRHKGKDPVFSVYWYELNVRHVLINGRVVESWIVYPMIMLEVWDSPL